METSQRVSAEEDYQGALLGSASVEGWGRQQEQAEGEGRLQCSLGESSADPMGCRRAGMVFYHCSELSWGAGPFCTCIHQSLDAIRRERYDLGQGILFSSTEVISGEG